MNKATAAASVAAVVAVAAGFTALGWNDNNATETAKHATTAGPVPVTVTITRSAPPAAPVTTTIASVPQVCLDALDNADVGFGYAAEAMRAAGAFDVAKLNSISEQLTGLAPTWNANKAACRAAGN